MRAHGVVLAIGAAALLSFGRGCEGSSSPNEDGTGPNVPSRPNVADAAEGVPDRDAARATDAPTCGTIDTRMLRPDTGFAFLLRYFAANGDVDEAGSRSNVIVYEDGRPLGAPHSSVTDVRSLGEGRYRHWRHTLSISASDNSDPRANGRTYTWSTSAGACPTPICGRVDVASAALDTGLNYIVEKSFGFRGDTNTSSTQSGLVLFEDGHELGPAHSVHADIRSLGHGRFSHWGNSLYFSSSDGSSPKTNGREYLYGGPCRRLASVEMTKISGDVPGYATFQSHNQKVVENEHGIFLTYLDQALPGTDELYRWKLLRSTDEGKTFVTLHEESRIGKAPVLETDEDGDIYVIACDGSATTTGDALFFHFAAATGFAPQAPARIAGAAAGKFSGLYDPTRKSFYYFTFNGIGDDFFTLDKAGNVVSKIQLVRNGPVGILQYPHLAMRGSTLYAAWTTVKDGVYLYWDIHFVKSQDGGKNWQKVDGTALTLPIVADDSGPADAIVPREELGSQNWLSSFYPKGDAVHFMYLSQPQQASLGDREHHVRWDTETSSIGRNHTPTWAGEALAIQSLDGFFASGDDNAETPLYAVSTYRPSGDWPSYGIVVLASDDNGTTWFDYALSRPFKDTYAIGGARRVARGHIDGTLTNVVKIPEPDAAAPNGQEAWFFRVKAD